MMARDPKYDIMKGIGIVLVVLGHCGIEFGHYIIYMFHMPLFFYVSGRLHRDKPIIEGIKSKFTSLAVPYIIFFAFCAFVDYFIFIDDPEFTINPLRPMNSGGPLWFLFAMLWVYIVYMFLNKRLHKYALFISILISVASYYLSVHEISLPLHIDSAASCLIFYAAGQYAQNFNFRYNHKLVYLSPLLLIFVLYGLYIIDFNIFHFDCNDLNRNKIMGNYSLFIISAVVGILLIESLSRVVNEINFGIIKALLIKLGRLSLYIFALHLLFINVFRYLYDAEGDLYYLIIAIISLSLSALIGLLMERRTNALIKELNSKW